MKKILTISAAATLVLSGCTKEAKTFDGTSLEGPETISAVFDEDSPRVAMTDDGTEVSYTWKNGDRILFVNPSDVTDSVYYTISDGVGTAFASFTKSSGNFQSGSSYICCHPGNGVRVSADGEFTDKNGKPILKGQNPTYVWNYMVFAGSNDSSYSFQGSAIPSSFNFKAPFTVLKVGVSNTSSAAITPNGIKIDGGKDSNYFLGTLKVDATSGIAASGAMDYLQTAISSGSEIAAGEAGAYSFMCVQNPSRAFSSLKVSIFY